MNCYICGRDEERVADFLSTGRKKIKLLVETLQDHLEMLKKDYTSSVQEYLEAVEGLRAFPPEYLGFQLMTVRRELEVVRQRSPEVELIIRYATEHGIPDSQGVSTVIEAMLGEPHFESDSLVRTAAEALSRAQVANGSMPTAVWSAIELELVSLDPWLSKELIMANLGLSQSGAKGASLDDVKLKVDVCPVCSAIHHKIKSDTLLEAAKGLGQR